MKQNIVFRIDFSGIFGYGHLIRCLTVLENIKKNNINFFFIILSSDFNNIFLKKIKKYKIFKFNYKTNNYYKNIKADLIFTKEILKKINKPTLIVDSYSINKNWCIQTSKLVKKIILFNDVLEKKIFCDVLIDHTFDRKINNYKKYITKKTSVFAGHQYAVLRKQFNLYLHNYKIQNNILISMGGTDPQNKTLEIIDFVTKIFSNSSVIVILNKSSKQISIIKKKYPSFLNKKKIIIFSDIYNIMPIYKKSSFCIGAGGVSALERCKIGLPSLVYQAAKNQSNIIENMKNNKLIKVWKNKKDLYDLLIMIKNNKYILNKLNKNCLKANIGSKTNLFYESILK